MSILNQQKKCAKVGASVAIARNFGYRRSSANAATASGTIRSVEVSKKTLSREIKKVFVIILSRFAALTPPIVSW